MRKCWQCDDEVEDTSAAVIAICNFHWEEFQKAIDRIANIGESIEPKIISPEEYRRIQKEKK